MLCIGSMPPLLTLYNLGRVKLNCDRSFDPKKGEATIGIVIRNHQARTNLSRVIVETDSVGIVQDITRSSGTYAWKIALIVYDIKEMMKQFADLIVSLVKRDANGAADWVVRQHNMGMDLSDWVNRPLYLLVFILNKDGLPCPH
ncbi:hypothetical protein COLO4_25526 [Corchorus olitorius]|uniref:RNase H type-1 domain-containing protein n=1 Tax=Corchorus olitorius TaxID=93759 RepID=A0A1R3I256_9ROSI|nr:hypothetical protein COLO4_25526 [Corchorus olitorius]